MENKLTNDQVTGLYNALDKVENTDNVNKILDNAEKLPAEVVETEMPEVVENLSSVSDEESLRNMGLSEETVEALKDIAIDNVDIGKIEASEKDYLDAFKGYDFTNEEAETILRVICRYNAGEEFDLYDACPDTVKNMADNIRLTGSGIIKMSKHNACKFIIDNFINDAKVSKVLDEYTAEMNDTMVSINKDFQCIVQDSINEIYANIDKIKEEDPERAETIEKIHQAFENSTKFKMQLDYLDRTNAKRLNKLYNKYNSECFYFNKKVTNDNGIKVPNIEKTYPIIRKALNGFTEEQIKKFIVVTCEATAKLDMDEIENIAYIYRMISNIVSFEFNTDFESDYAKSIFDGIKTVIQKIIKLQ